MAECRAWTTRPMKTTPAPAILLTTVVLAAVWSEAAAAAGAPPYAFPDARQAAHASTLPWYSVVVPYKLQGERGIHGAQGEGLSHDLRHTHALSSHRSRRSVDHGVGDHVFYVVQLDGHHYTMQLRPYRNFVADHAVLERRGGLRHLNGSRSVLLLGKDTACHYRGHLLNAPQSTVALSACDGLRGYVRRGTDHFLIEPVKGHPREPGEPHPHLVYRLGASHLTPTHPSNLHQSPTHHSPNSIPSSSRRNIPPSKPHASQQPPHDVREALGEDLQNLEVSDYDGNVKHAEEAARISPCGTADSMREAWLAREAYEASKSTNVSSRRELPRADAPSRRSSSRRRRRSVSKERNVEVLVVADRQMVEYYSNEDLSNYILTVMNMVSQVFHDASIGNAINVVVVRVMLLESGVFEEELTISHHADDTLRSFCNWQHLINPSDDDHPHHHDVAVLITRYNLCSQQSERCSTLGLAEIAGMCHPRRSCNVNEDTGLQLAYTIAHEMGHNFGMEHDGSGNGCRGGGDGGEPPHVMSPHLSVEAHPLSWSPCSREEVTQFLDRDWGSCLDDTPPSLDYQVPVLPPGAMYDASHQCRLTFGAGASECSSMADVCQTLWCLVEDRCISRLEPAAEGTQCGKHQWCSGGRCVTMGERPAAINGNWGTWSAWSECSRTCGAGVAAAERRCDNPEPEHGGAYCTGQRRRYRICNTQDCPSDTPSPRAVQCSKFDHKPFKGIEDPTWSPVLYEATPCELHCTPHAAPAQHHHSERLLPVVTDGTPCRPGTRDMCISGLCKRVSCDWTIEGTAQEDRCGLCHGDGTQCVTYRGVYRDTDGTGYRAATMLPEGARTVRIGEDGDASSYLALYEERTNTWHLNGNLTIQWSGEYPLPGGGLMHYKREGDQEEIFIPGPLPFSLTLMVLLLSPQPGVHWEYTLARDNATYTPSFEWRRTEWSACSRSCGGGEQEARPQCMEAEAGLVEDRYCSASPPPPHQMRACNLHPCPAWWWAGPWQPCSRTCGPGGTMRRTVICVRSLGGSEQVALLDSDCEERDRPHDTAPCREAPPCPTDLTWSVGPWLQTCGGDPCSTERRVVECLLPGGDCDPLTRPPHHRRCGNITCGAWTTGDWSLCSSACGGGVQFRSVTCEGGIACELSIEPRSVRECQGPCDAELQPPTQLDMLNMNVPSHYEEEIAHPPSIEKDEASAPGHPEENSTDQEIERDEQKDIDGVTGIEDVNDPEESGTQLDHKNNDHEEILGINNDTNSIEFGNSSHGNQSDVESNEISEDHKKEISNENMTANEETTDQSQGQDKNETTLTRVNSSQLSEIDKTVQSDTAKNLTELQSAASNRSEESTNGLANESLLNISQPPTILPAESGPTAETAQSRPEPLPTEKIDTGIVLEYDFMVPSTDEQDHNPPESEDLAGSSNQSADKTNFKEESHIFNSDENGSENATTKNLPQHKNNSAETGLSQTHTDDETAIPDFYGNSNYIDNVEPSKEDRENKAEGSTQPIKVHANRSQPEETNVLDTDFTTQEYEYDPLDKVYGEQYDEYEYEYDDHPVSSDETGGDSRPVGIVEDKMNIDDFEIVEVVQVPVRRKNKNKHHRNHRARKKNKKNKRKHRQKFVVHEGEDAINVLNEILGRHDTHELESQDSQATNFEPPAMAFDWNVSSWSNCSANCNTGVQLRTVQCQDTATGTAVDQQYCAHLIAPPHTQNCNEDACLDWTVAEWSSCSAECGPGTRTREVTCPVQHRCLVSEMPSVEEPCTERACVEWWGGPWSLCTRPCGVGGYQIRAVRCVQRGEGLTPGTGCPPQLKPPHKRSCNEHPCNNGRRGQVRQCKDRLDPQLCGRLLHMCSTKFFRAKCCLSCRRHEGRLPSV